MTLVSLGALAAVFTMLLAVAGPSDAADLFEPAPEALDRVASSMPPAPGGLGPAATDRGAWSTVARRTEVRSAVAQAESLLAEPMPPMTDDLYLDYSRTGNRRRGEAVYFARRSRLQTLALAECGEGKGRFLPAIEEAIRSICAEKSWVMPAHDGNLQTFQGRLITVDLGAAMLAWNLGAIHLYLRDRLSPDVRALIRSELERRIFAPYRAMVAGKQPQYWLTVRNNWNAVCLAGVTGAALCAIEDRRERAWFALAAEHYSRYSLEGFGPDGYCDEGVGYWNYGFGHYVALAETIRRATGGALDLLDRPGVVMPAAYGSRVVIADGVCPAFADCAVDARPSSGLVDYLSRRYAGKGTERRRGLLSGGLCDQVMALHPDNPPVIWPEKPWPKPDPLRTWFEHEMVLISRPAPRSKCRLAVAIQGGHNAQNHNHNDVGVFMAVVGGKAVLADIGAEVYTARTFGPQRYVSRALNSWGHAVPVVGGQLQRSGRDAAARVLATEFTPERDTLRLDIRAAYDLPALTRLERSYVFDRNAAGVFTVTDTFAFASPATFETALLTFGTWERLGPRALRIADGGEAVRVEIEAPSGAEVDVEAEPVNEDLVARRAATRIGIRLRDPLRAGDVVLRITPEPKT